MGKYNNKKEGCGYRDMRCEDIFKENTNVFNPK